MRTSVNIKNDNERLVIVASKYRERNAGFYSEYNLTFIADGIYLTTFLLQEVLIFSSNQFDIKTLVSGVEKIDSETGFIQLNELFNANQKNSMIMKLCDKGLIDIIDALLRKKNLDSQR